MKALKALKMFWNAEDPECPILTPRTVHDQLNKILNHEDYQRTATMRERQRALEPTQLSTRNDAFNGARRSASILQQSLSRRTFAPFASMLVAGATIPFLNEPAMAQ